MTQPTIEQLERDFREMDIPNVGGEGLRNIASRFDELLQLYKKGYYPHGISAAATEEAIRSLFAEIERDYGVALYAPVKPDDSGKTFMHECGM